MRRLDVRFSDAAVSDILEQALVTLSPDAGKEKLILLFGESFEILNQARLVLFSRMSCAGFDGCESRDFRGT